MDQKKQTSHIVPFKVNQTADSLCHNFKKKFVPTTPVVPSPISSSCDLDRSTSNFAISCSTFICSNIVAPSFVIVTSESGDTSILSIPAGKR